MSDNAHHPLQGSAALRWFWSPVSTEYNSSVDVVRLVAAFLIVMFHANAMDAVVAEAATGYFVLVMSYFACRSAGRGAPQPLGTIAARRAPRLLRPFAIWVAITIAALYIKSQAAGMDFRGEVLARWLPPQGVFGQLWFLPFAFVVTVALQAVFQSRRPRVSTLPGLALGTALAVAIGAGVLLFLARSDLSPYARINLLYLPMVPAGCLMACIERRGLLILAALALSASGAALAAAGIAHAAILLFAPVVALAAILIVVPRQPWSQMLGPLALDVYLVHILVIAALAMVLPAIGLPADLPAVALGVLACLVSLAIAALLQRPALSRIFH